MQGKLDQYRSLQKAGKDLKSEQKVALAKWDEVNVTLDFSREFSKQITQIAVSAERDAKKQAKKVKNILTLDVHVYFINIILNKIRSH